MSPSTVMSHLAGFVRSVVPVRARDFFGNCGGRNLHGSRFAGNLDTRGVDDEQFLAICHSLIFSNGVRKTTSPARNKATLEWLFETGLAEVRGEIDVLDAGCSIGLDAQSTFDLLAGRATVRSYTLGDLHASVLYDRARHAVFDEEHRLLQVKDRLGFTSIYFSYNEPAQRLTNLPKRVRPWLLKRRYRFAEGSEVVRIPLIHPNLKLDGDSPFQVRRLDVFDKPTASYDFIVCMHLLVSRYFTKETIAAAERNLADGLRPGGTMIVGASEEGRVWRRVSTSDFEVRDFKFR